MMLNNLRTVDFWYDTPFQSGGCLNYAFEEATKVGNPSSYFFGDIWIPILVRNQDHSPKMENGNFVFEYKNVGLTIQQLADAYWTLYSRNMLVQPLITTNSQVMGEQILKLAKRIRAILELNKYKYLKWIDTMGYAYNPLWNVDGSESYQFIDKHGNIIRNNTPILQTDTTNQVITYDGNLRDGTKSSSTYQGLAPVDDPHALYSKSEEIYNNIDQLTDSINGTVHAVTGGDFSHIEKRVRQGNIGVTQTTQLIESERELVRFNLIQEFFDDINKQILVGLYPDF